MSRPRRIALDFDSTVWPTQDVWRHLTGDPRFNAVTCPSWNHPVEWAGGPEAFLRLGQQACQPEVMHRYSPLPDSMETLNELAELGLELELLTALPNDTIKTALEVLEKHGHKPHAATTCSAEQKVAYCLANGIDLLVDDAPITLEHAHTAGLPVTALRWGYNSATLDRLAIPHASNWTDLRIVIHQLLGLESE